MGGIHSGWMGCAETIEVEPELSRGNAARALPPHAPFQICMQWKAQD